MRPFFPLRGPGLSPAEIVRDEEARVAALPLFLVLAPDRTTLTEVALSVCPGRLWLPGLEAAEPSGVPDDTWQGWRGARAGERRAGVAARDAAPRPGCLS